MNCQCIARREVKQSSAGPEFQDTRTITLVLLNSLKLYKKQVADPFTCCDKQRSMMLMKTSFFLVALLTLQGESTFGKMAKLF